MPVCHEHHDALVGFLHAEDVLRLTLDEVDVSKVDLREIMHPPVVAPPTKYVDEMFDFFQANNARAAAVLNEFGGMDGFITMRDIISFIFGEVSESVPAQALYEERDENVFEVPGEMKLTDFDDLTNFGIEDPRMTTIGGVVFRYLDRLPVVGDQVVMDGLIATVLEMDGHRLARVRIAKGTPGEGSETEDMGADQEAVEAAERKTAAADADETGAPGSVATASDEARPSAEVVDLSAVKGGGKAKKKARKRNGKDPSDSHDRERG